MYEDTEGSAKGSHSRTFGKTTKLGQPGIAPSGYRVVAVDTPSSPELRDLASLRRDIELARSYAEAFALVGKDLNDSRDTRIAFWHSAVVFYGRAFNQGARATRLSIAELTDDQRKLHQFLLDLRNKHVAHAVNDYEYSVVVAYLTDSAFAARQITRIGQTHMEVLIGDDDLIEQFMELCQGHLKHISWRMQVLTTKVQREVQAMGLDAVYALSAPEGLVGKRDHVKKRRK